MEYLVLTKANILKLGFEKLEILAMHVKKMQSFSSQQESLQQNPFETESFKSANLISKIKICNLEKFSKSSQDCGSDSPKHTKFNELEDTCCPAVPRFKFPKFNLKMSEQFYSN